MNKFTQKWAIVAFLEDVLEGTEFYYTDFPLHVTLAGVFEIDKNGEEIVERLSDLLVNQSAVIIHAKQKALFGPDQNIAVMTIKKDAELFALHKLIHDWLIKSRASYNTPEYEGLGYLPHSTFQKSGSLKPGEKRFLKSISLIDLFPYGNGYQRKITKTVWLR